MFPGEPALRPTLVALRLPAVDAVIANFQSPETSAAPPTGTAAPRSAA